MDDTRKVDLQDLEHAKQQATSTAERMKIEQIQDKIKHEDSHTGEQRRQLVNAMRGGDTKFVKQISQQLHEQEEQHG